LSMDVSSVAVCVIAHITWLLCWPPAVTVGRARRKRSAMPKRRRRANDDGEWHYQVINVRNNNRFHNINAQPQGMERIDTTPANSAAHRGQWTGRDLILRRIATNSSALKPTGQSFSRSDAACCRALWGEWRGDYIHRRGCTPNDGAPPCDGSASRMTLADP